MKRILRPALALAALSALAAPLAACGPGGVTLGDDWEGSTVFVLSKVNGLTTVVGIDPDRHRAEPLAVVPTQKDDDDIQNPQIIHLTDGRWAVAVPKKNAKPSVLYQVDTKEHDLAGLGHVQGASSLVPAGPRTFAVSSAALSPTHRARALVYDPATWQVERQVPLPIDATVAAGSVNRLCISEVMDTGSRVAVITPKSTGKQANVHTVTMRVQNISCGPGKPVLAASAVRQTAGGPLTLQLRTQDGLDIVTASAGSIGQVASTRDTVTAAITLPHSVELVEVSRDDGRELRHMTMRNINEVQGMSEASPGTWVLVAGNQAVTADLTHSTSHSFKLPGELIDSPQA
ncbi:hypothetical protein [Streptomyces sp. MUSC 125]|uniref:hypothetical protein n=1 Tax=Streptomyces sp. MUSC 125 TaxID=1428624 RepID=UPI00068FE18B|nr:hypothetical protein [Streptomyces sp. MUSC 125]